MRTTSFCMHQDTKYILMRLNEECNYGLRALRSDVRTPYLKHFLGGPAASTCSGIAKGGPSRAWALYQC